MKTERRQDLKTNELSVYLKQAGEYVSNHAAAIMVSAVVVVAVVAAVVYANHTTIRGRELGWQAYREALGASFRSDPDNADWATDTIARWEAVAAYDDPAIESQARSKLAQFCLREFMETEEVDFKKRLLDIAEENCLAILDRHPDNTTVRAAALSAMAAVEQNRYVLDGEDGHRERSLGYLERLRNDPEFIGTPFQADALSRLNEFERLWQPLVLVDPPPPSEPEPAFGEQQADEETQSSEEPGAVDEVISDPQAPEQEQAADEVGEDQPESDAETEPQASNADPAASDAKPEQTQPAEPDEP